MSIANTFSFIYTDYKEGKQIKCKLTFLYINQKNDMEKKLSHHLIMLAATHQHRWFHFYHCQS